MKNITGENNFYMQKKKNHCQMYILFITVSMPPENELFYTKPAG